MADDAIVASVRRYLRALNERGIPAKTGVLFGSWARGHAEEWSDIDLIVLSSAFDGDADREALVNQLWRVAARTDSRIEPIACGEHQWVEDRTSALIEIARREGVPVTLDERSQ